MFPNPKTSGNVRYTYLAAWGAMEQAFGGNRAQARTRAWMQISLANVEVFDTGGLGATTTFVERWQGDVLISFESEVNTLRDQAGAGDEVIVPATNISAEFSVAWVDKKVKKNGTAQAVKAYLNYLYSPAAQQIIAGFYYRVNDTKMMKANENKFRPTRLFRVEDRFGGSQSAMATNFDRSGELDRLLAARHR